MQFNAPDRNNVKKVIDTAGYGIYSSEVAPFGFLVKLSNEVAETVSAILEAAGYPVKVISSRILIVYGTDPVAAIDAQITALQRMRARLTGTDDN